MQNRWPFALRAAACMAVPALIGWLAGDLASGLMATIGAFTSLYGSGRPYLNRGVHLGVVAVCFALAVALGNPLLMKAFFARSWFGPGRANDVIWKAARSALRAAPMATIGSRARGCRRKMDARILTSRSAS